MQRLTKKVELVWKDTEEYVAVHGKQDGEVGTKGAPYEEMVDGCPVASVQCNLNPKYK